MDLLIDFFRVNPEVGGRSRASRPQGAQGMCVVDKHTGTMAFRDAEQRVQSADIPVHGIHTIDHDQATAARAQPGKLYIEIGYVVVGEMLYLHPCQPASIEQAAMRTDIQHGHIAWPQHGTEHCQVGVITGVESGHRLHPEKICQRLFQFMVNPGRSGQQAHAPCPGTITLDGGNGPGHDGGVAYQAQIVIGRKHEQAPPAALHPWPG